MTPRTVPAPKPRSQLRRSNHLLQRFFYDRHKLIILLSVVRSETAHVDRFVLQGLPPVEQWPEIRLQKPQFVYPDLWVPIIRSWALTRGYALHPGTSCVASFTGSSRCWHGLRCVAGARRTSSTNTEELPDQPRQGFGHPQGLGLCQLATVTARQRAASSSSKSSTVSTVVSACLARRSCSCGSTSPLLRSKTLECTMWPNPACRAPASSSEDPLPT